LSPSALLHRQPVPARTSCDSHSAHRNHKRNSLELINGAVLHKYLLHTCIAFIATATVVLNAIVTLSAVGARGNLAVVDVVLTQLAFVARVGAITRETVDSIHAQPSIATR